MKIRNILTVLTATTLLAACTLRTTDVGDAVSPEDSSNWHVHAVEVTIPDELTTTEINTYLPNVDIIWHGDPVGDRHAQVGVILEDAIAEAAQVLMPENYHRPVAIQATLIDFHSLTPKARAMTGGVHKVRFSIQVVDMNTGEVLAGPSIIEADEFAYGGWQAVKAETEGQTMKLRISNRITEVVKSWLGLVTGQDAVEQTRVLAIGR